jgi:hypothetical protein
MQLVEIFINESSWNSKNYKDYDILKENVDIFRQMLSLIIEKNKSYSSLSLFFDEKGLDAFLNDEDVKTFERQNLKQILQRLKKAKDWQETEYKQHSHQDNFYYLDLLNSKIELVNNTSLAEITHRKLCKEDSTFLVLNFGNSPYGREKFLSLLKKSRTELPQITHIQQIDTVEELRKWLRVEIEWKNCLESSKFEEIKEIYEKSFLNSFDFNSWNPSSTYLPFAEISNHLVNNDWNSFRNKLRSKANEKMSVISQIAKQVATINGYIYDEKISKLNHTKEHKREIYSAGENRNKIYLSVDFETGGYEICDFQGKHLGEFWFDGIRSKEEDKKGKRKHDIKIEIM